MADDQMWEDIISSTEPALPEPGLGLDPAYDAPMHYGGDCTHFVPI